jgi:hypothetical protein
VRITDPVDFPRNLPEHFDPSGRDFLELPQRSQGGIHDTRLLAILLGGADQVVSPRIRVAELLLQGLGLLQQSFQAAGLGLLLDRLRRRWTVNSSGTFMNGSATRTGAAGS